MCYLELKLRTWLRSTVLIGDMVPGCLWGPYSSGSVPPRNPLYRVFFCWEFDTKLPIDPQTFIYRSLSVRVHLLCLTVVCISDIPSITLDTGRTTPTFPCPVHYFCPDLQSYFSRTVWVLLLESIMSFPWYPGDLW